MCMNAYKNINWKKHVFEGVVDFMNEEHLEGGFIDQLLKEGHDKIKKYKKTKPIPLESVFHSVPGKNYYFKTAVKSYFDESEHIKLITALKIITGEENKKYFHVRTALEFYNSVKSELIKENEKFLKNAENIWNGTMGNKPIVINSELYNYALRERFTKIKDIFKLPKEYKEVDLVPFSHEEDDNFEVNMTCMENVLETGRVAKFLPPLLDEPFIFEKESFPKVDKLYNSKLGVSQDANVAKILENHNVDVVIPLCSLKRLLNYTDTNQKWNIPIKIKEMSIEVNGQFIKKKVIFIDKPLPKLEVTQVDFLERSSKLLVRRNFCKREGFVFQVEENKSITRNENSEELQKEKELDETQILQNTSYKIWSIGQNSKNISLIKGQENKHAFKILIRSKVDACELNDSGSLQAVTVLPKIEYQMDFGGSIHTKKELISQWTSLYFKPYSSLKRIRHQYKTLEVVKAENCNIAKINKEALDHHNMKPHFGLGVLYKIFMALQKFGEGDYLLNREQKYGAFLVLLEAQNQDSYLSTYNLHEVFGLQAKVNEGYVKPWLPIDTNVILPIFEYKGHMPGLFPPRKPCPKFTAKDFKARKAAINKRKKKAAAKKKATTDK